MTQPDPPTAASGLEDEADWQKQERLRELLRDLENTVINGVVGFAGLPVTLATLEAGKRLGLANKESLIAAGPVVQRVSEPVPLADNHPNEYVVQVGDTLWDIAKAKLGDATLYTKIVEMNGLAGKVCVLQGRIEDIMLPVDKVDIIVSEWMGYFLIFERMLDSFATILCAYSISRLSGPL